jgi:hypothetical protein
METLFLKLNASQLSDELTKKKSTFTCNSRAWCKTASWPFQVLPGSKCFFVRVRPVSNDHQDISEELRRHLQPRYSCSPNFKVVEVIFYQHILGSISGAWNWGSKNSISNLKISSKVLLSEHFLFLEGLFSTKIVRPSEGVVVARRLIREYIQYLLGKWHQTVLIFFCWNWTMNFSKEISAPET